MKKIIKTTMITLSLFTLASCYHKIGRLVIVSTRNMDSKTEYVLLDKGVMGKGKVKKGEALETAIDRSVAKYPTGEFMKNIVISINASGRKIRVIGDVWGTPVAEKAGEKVEKSVKKTVNATIEFKTGDKVTFKNPLGKLIEGTIIGTNQNTAVVEYSDGSKKEIVYEKLTKIEK